MMLMFYLYLISQLWRENHTRNILPESFPPLDQSFLQGSDLADLGNFSGSKNIFSSTPDHTVYNR